MTKRHEPMTANPREPAEHEAGGVLTVNLAAIVSNWRTLRARANAAHCAAVVKADAYGCGIVPVSTALVRAGCSTFFVTDLAEGRQVREIAPDATIYLLNGLPPGAGSSFAPANLRPVLGSRVELAEWNAFCDATGWRGGAALHIDTGINRLGIAPDEAGQLAATAAVRHITLLMSHLACADQPEHPLNARQVALFHSLRASFPGIAASLANSSGIFLGPDVHHELVRPGVALYGANPTPAHLNPMRSAVSLQGRIVQLREIGAGETVGYGGAWTARRATVIAIIALGYADGYPRAAGAYDTKRGADAIIAGRRCPVAGRISMDLMAVDVSDLPEMPRRGEFATLLNEEIGVDELAFRAGTIAYEILSHFGRRYRRVYSG